MTSGREGVAGLVVCGFYTPDYRHWVPDLEAGIEHSGAKHDFVEMARVAGGWEANTRQKPVEVMHAMVRHSGDVIVFIDVDCTVRGDLSPLEALRADVAFYLKGKIRRGGGYALHARSGTLVLKPTNGAREFVQKWIALSRSSRYGDVDQTSLALAIGECPKTTFQPLAETWCGTKGDPCALTRTTKQAGLSGKWAGSRTL